MTILLGFAGPLIMIFLALWSGEAIGKNLGESAKTAKLYETKKYVFGIGIIAAIATSFLVYIFISNSSSGTFRTLLTGLAAPIAACIFVEVMLSNSVSSFNSIMEDRVQKYKEEQRQKEMEIKKIERQKSKDKFLSKLKFWK